MTEAVVDTTGRYITRSGVSHFSPVEFQCRCGACPPLGVAADLIEMLEMIRNDSGGPLHVLSGIRCKAHNVAVGGAVDSWHVPELHGGLGCAADIVSRMISVEKLSILAARALGRLRGGLGIYPTWVHVDVRPQPTHWRET